LDAAYCQDATARFGGDRGLVKRLPNKPSRSVACSLKLVAAKGFSVPFNAIVSRYSDFAVCRLMR